MNVEKKSAWSPFFLLKNLFASSSGAMVAEICTLPICTLKTNFQNSQTPHYSISQTCRSIYDQHGWRGFFNASRWAVSSQMLSTCSKYVLYESMKNSMNPFLAGAVSGALASLASHPFDVFKVHKQMHSVKQIHWDMWYRGYSKTLSKSICGSILFFPLFDTFQNHLPAQNVIFAALASAVCSTVLIHPLDLMKTRQIYAQSIRFEEWRMYFKGLSLNLLRVVPHFVITMAVIEKIKKNF